MLTEVRLGHAVVDHLVAQLAWWAGQRTEASGGRGRQQPCVCSLGGPFPPCLSLGVPSSDQGKIPGSLLGTGTHHRLAAILDHPEAAAAETTGGRTLTLHYAGLFLIPPLFMERLLWAGTVPGAGDTAVTRSCLPSQ